MWIYISSTVVILFGIVVILDPSAPITLIGIPKGGDVTPIKWELGFILIFSGILLFYSEYRKKIKNKHPQYTICPTCKETFNHNELENGKCKYCKDVDTVDIEQYYKDNPKEKDEK